MKGGHISVAVPMLNESESVDALSRCGFPCLAAGHGLELRCNNSSHAKNPQPHSPGICNPNTRCNNSAIRRSRYADFQPLYYTKGSLFNYQ